MFTLFSLLFHTLLEQKDVSHNIQDAGQLQTDLHLATVHHAASPVLGDQAQQLVYPALLVYAATRQHPTDWLLQTFEKMAAAWLVLFQPSQTTDQTH